MLTYAKLAKTSRKFVRFTGLTVAEFDHLAAQVEPLWEAAEQRRLTQRQRQRHIGGGGQYKLETFKDKLLVPLMYYRLYLSYELLAWLVWGACVQPESIGASTRTRISGQTQAPPPSVLKRRIRNWEEFRQAYPDLTEVVIDAMEQPIARPRGKKRQKPYYSRKRKRHTIKTQIVVTRSGRVIWVSESVPGGKVHDYQLLKRTRVLERLPKRVTKRVDLGYQGIERDYSDHKVVIPKKKPPKQELRKTEKRQNRKKAKQWIVVEHTLAHLKQFQILTQTYRNRRGRNNQSYNRKINIVAGLVNLRYDRKAI